MTEPLYQLKAWKAEAPVQATFAHHFAALNARRYFEIFQIARLTMPLFALFGALVVFMWSRRLYGEWGGLLSLTLWVICPNVLAHSRLITTDMGATAFGVAATYVFWTYLQKSNWRWAVAAGLMLGLAQLTKFSMLVLVCGLSVHLACAPCARLPEGRMVCTRAGEQWGRGPQSSPSRS